MTWRVREGASKTSPDAAILTAAISCSGAPSLSRKPVAPSRKAS